MKYYSLILFLILISCSNQRVVELPEISHADVSEVLDVSPAYIFYDETEKDSVLFNRKNLIGTTNWLVNVDKRLSLKQAMPHLVYLQNKRQKKGMHNNEKARNYFTCNDISKKTLGFIDFTDTSFILDAYKSKNDSQLVVYNLNDIGVKLTDHNAVRTSIEDLGQELSNSLASYEGPKSLNLLFDDQLSFQDYITVKESLGKLIEVHNLRIEDEYFLNLKLLN